MESKLSDAIKRELHSKILKTVKEKRIKQKELAKLIGWKQPRISDLLNYYKDGRELKSRTFSVDSMLYACECLQIEVSIKIKDSKISLKTFLE